MDADTGILRYHVYRDGARIAAPLFTSFEDTNLSERTVYGFEVRAVNLHGIEGEGALVEVRTREDRDPPRIRSVVAVAGGDVRIRFDEPIEPSEALVRVRSEAEFGFPPTSSRIDGDVDVHSVDSGNDPHTVLLRTAPMSPERLYHVQVEGVRDRSEAPNSGREERSFVASGSPGLIGYWSMDEPGALELDRSGAGHRTAVRGSAEAADGRIGYGLGLAGDGCLEITPSEAMDEALAGDFTVSAWVRPARLPPASDVSNRAFSIFSAPSADLSFRFDGVFVAALGRGEERIELSSGVLEPGRWHHVAMVRDTARSALSLYVGGSEVLGSPRSIDRSPRPVRWESPNYAVYYGKCRIGAHDPRFALESHRFEGVIDELRFHARALRPEELRRLP